jgi:hypothetical protein
VTSQKSISYDDNGLEQGFLAGLRRVNVSNDNATNHSDFFKMAAEYRDKVICFIIDLFNPNESRVGHSAIKEGVGAGFHVGRQLRDQGYTEIPIIFVSRFGLTGQIGIQFDEWVSRKANLSFYIGKECDDKERELVNLINVCVERRLENEITLHFESYASSLSGGDFISFSTADSMVKYREFLRDRISITISKLMDRYREAGRDCFKIGDEKVGLTDEFCHVLFERIPLMRSRADSLSSEIARYLFIKAAEGIVDPIVCNRRWCLNVDNNCIFVVAIQSN